MEGPHLNLAGLAGYGEIPGKEQPETEAWEAQWEGELNAIYAVLSAGDPGSKPGDPGYCNIDMMRYYREVMEPRDHTNMSYYELWVHALSVHFDLTGRGRISRADLVDGPVPIISKEQLDRARRTLTVARGQRVLGFDEPNEQGLYESREYAEETAPKPRYRVGQKVRCAIQYGANHSRGYTYFRGREGVIAKVYPVSILAPGSATGQSGLYEKGYPDTESRGLQNYFLPLYNVRFAARDLWGDGFGEADTCVYVDLWEPYVEPLSRGLTAPGAGGGLPIGRG